jgi:hypothetical protein
VTRVEVKWGVGYRDTNGEICLLDWVECREAAVRVAASHNRVAYELGSPYFAVSQCVSFGELECAS